MSEKTAKRDRKIEAHTFDLVTEIIVNIKWGIPPVNDNELLEREKFEMTIRNFANFINKELGTVILSAMQQANKEAKT